MSHYTVTVVLPEAPKNNDHVEEMLQTLLAPFNEELEVEPYKDRTEPVVEHWRHATERELRWPYSVVRENDPEIDLGDPLAVAAFMNKRYGDDSSEQAYHVDDEGLFQWSTYNPESKWDWYAIGGRWNGVLTMKDASGVEFKGNYGRKGDIVEPHITYAVLAEGVWRSPGKMGWFGASSEGEAEQVEYEKWFQKFWNGLGDDAWVVVVDLHI